MRNFDCKAWRSGFTESGYLCFLPKKSINTHIKTVFCAFFITSIYSNFVTLLIPIKILNSNAIPS
jgi:hypothetical protein